MNRVVTSLCVFAFTGFILSSGISVVGTAIQNFQTAFGQQAHAHHHQSLVSYERTL